MASALPPPPCTGPVASEDKSVQLLAIAFILWALAATCVLLRFLSRYWAKAGFWFDDWLILVPLCCSLGYTLSTIPLHQKGFGKHYNCAEPDAIPFFLKTLLAWEFLYTVIIATTKYSILLFLYRVFRVPSFKRWACVMGLVITAWAIAVLIVSGFSCRPLHAFWGDGTGKCVDTKKFFVGNSVPNIITDLALLILPLPYISRLNAPRSYKIALIGVFGCGVLVVAISIARLVSLLSTGTSADVIWEDVPEAMWTITEDNIAIVSACLPSMGPLLKICLKRSDLNSATPWWRKSSQVGDNSGRSQIVKNRNVGDSRSKRDSGFIELRDLGTPNQTHDTGEDNKV